jgi:pseudomonalisin
MLIRPRMVAATVFAAGLLMGLSAGAASAASWAATATQAMRLVNATSLGATPAATPVRLAVGLRDRDASGLAALARAVNTPGSPEYGHFLTPAQFTATYAPTAAQADAVATYLRSEGFSGVTLSSNRLYVTAVGTAAEAQQAFNTSLASFRQNGRDVFANTSAAQVPASLAGTVLSVLGLNDVSGFSFPLQTKTSASSAAPAASAATNCQLDPTSGSPYGLCEYTPQEFRSAYDTGTKTGSGTAIAIMAEGDLSGVVKDLRTAEAAFGEPQVPYTIEPVGVPSSDTSGADEWDLDTQYSTGMASTVKRLYIYDTTTLTDSDIGLEFNHWASQDLAKAGSASFGECEEQPYVDGLMVTNDEVMNEAAVQGQTMHASSGDTGGQSCAVAPTNGVPESGLPEVNYPCSSQYIVCVGGTSLFTNANGSYDTELGWYAGGGGVSTFEDSPSWQSCVVPSNSGSTLGVGRGAPDIAMDADANTGADVYVNGSPEEVGGTSLSSPLALGAWAVAETANANHLGFASPLLYGLYPSAANCTDGIATPPTGQLGTSSSDPGYPLHDVVLGSNGTYAAAPGWDYVTGLGSYDVAKAAAALGKETGS